MLSFKDPRTGNSGGYGILHGVMVYGEFSGLKGEVKDQGSEVERRHVAKLQFHGYF